MESRLNKITIVTGGGRCGTSLVMQMLDAGGMRVHGEFPSYEDGPVLHKLAALQGMAVKVLDPEILCLPSSYAYDVIWIDRDPFEQAKSHVKFLSVVAGVRPEGRAIMALRKSFQKDRDKYLNFLRAASRGRIKLLKFESILAHPHDTASELDVFCGHLNTLPMANQVRPRSPLCRKEMLEVQLMEEGKLR